MSLKSNMLILLFLFSIVSSFSFAQSNTVKTDYDNVVILLDGSGSMDDPLGRVRKIDAAKKAIKKVVSGIPDTTRIGVLVFSQDLGPQRAWVYDLGEKDMRKLSSAIDPVRPNGGTPLGTYIKYAADRLLQQRENQYNYGTYKLLVVTDGEASGNGEYERMIKYAPEVVSRGITLDVIGVGMPRGHALQSFANSYRNANDPKSLESAVTQVFAEIGGNDDEVSEDFELLSGLPDGSILPIIEAISKSSSSNHPIGGKPRASVNQEKGTQTASSSPNTTPKNNQKSGVGIMDSFVVIVLVFCFIVFMREVL